MLLVLLHIHSPVRIWMDGGHGRHVNIVLLSGHYVLRMLRGGRSLMVVRHWGVVRVLLRRHHDEDDYLTILEIFFSVCSNGETK